MKNGLIVLLTFFPAYFAPEPGATEELRQQIDGRIEAAWATRSIEPVGISTDAEFLRRVYLDLVGTIPTIEEAMSFLDDPGSTKRALLIDRLLEDPQFAKHQAEVWDMILFGRRPPGFGTDKRVAFQAWMREQFGKNTPYDQWVRAILRAEGNTVEHGAPMYFVQYKDNPEDAAEAITQTFLGIQLQCARCHDHPFEPWSQLDFYGTAAFFARLRVVDVGKQDKLTKFMIGERNTGEVLFTGPASEQEVGKKGEPVLPKFLNGGELSEPALPAGFKEDRNFPNGKVPTAPHFSRKEQWADWVTGGDNPYFARAIANRLWAQFMGRGIVDPVDNMSESNEASHPELLAELTAAIVEHQFDLQWTIRELLNSRTYQLTSKGEVEAAKPLWFEQGSTRPLSAEELLDSWKVAVNWSAVEEATSKNPTEDRYAPLGSGYLLEFLGQPNNGVGDFQGGLQEHLFFNNGGIAKLMTSANGSLHHSLMQSAAPWEERVDRLYLATLSRRPTDAERAQFVQYLSSDAQPDRRLQEAIWVLMTCSEFRFNH
jgi:hypothetical protein